MLISALLITPAAAAALLTRSLPRMMLLASAIAVLSGGVGLYVSFYAEVASGAAIVLTATGCFGLAWLGRLLARLPRRRGRPANAPTPEARAAQNETTA